MKIEWISLKKIYDSGQTFRWLKLSDQKYIVPYLSGACEIVQRDEMSAEITQTFGKKQDWAHYFDLGRNYQKIEKELKSAYPKFENAIDFSKGIRILNQAEFETLITFIFSANNNIKRIMNSVNMICEKYGKKIYEFEDVQNSSFESKFDRSGELFLFPSIKEMAKITEEEYRAFGAGYRAPYLAQTSNYLVKHKKEYENYKNLDDASLLKALESLKGVGPKVARCISLFAYSREEFPIDTWIKKAIKAEFDMEGASDTRIAKKVDEYFTIYRGIIQQYIFYYYRFKK